MKLRSQSQWDGVVVIQSTQLSYERWASTEFEKQIFIAEKVSEGSAFYLKIFPTTVPHVV